MLGFNSFFGWLVWVIIPNDHCHHIFCFISDVSRGFSIFFQQFLQPVTPEGFVAARLQKHLSWIIILLGSLINVSRQNVFPNFLTVIWLSFFKSAPSYINFYLLGFLFVLIVVVLLFF